MTYAISAILLSMLAQSDLAGSALVLLSSHPILLMAFAHAAWISAWLVLGHPPRPTANDPKDFGPPVSGILAATMIVMLTYIHVMAVSIMVDLGRAIVAMLNKKTIRCLMDFPLLVRAVAWISVPVYAMLDPFQIFEWIMD